MGACIATPLGAAAARARSFSACRSCFSCLASALAERSEWADGVEPRRSAGSAGMAPPVMCPCSLALPVFRLWPSSVECSVGVGEGMLDAAMGDAFCRCYKVYTSRPGSDHVGLRPRETLDRSVGLIRCCRSCLNWMDTHSTTSCPTYIHSQNRQSLCRSRPRCRVDSCCFGAARTRPSAVCGQHRNQQRAHVIAGLGHRA